MCVCVFVYVCLFVSFWFLNVYHRPTRFVLPGVRLHHVVVRRGADPSSAALFCVRSGPMEVVDGLNSSKEGEELFKEDRR